MYINRVAKGQACSHRELVKSIAGLMAAKSRFCPKSVSVGAAEQKNRFCNME